MNKFISLYQDIRVDNIKKSHRKIIKIKGNWSKVIFDGDLLLKQKKSPDYIIFLFNTKCILYCIEVHKARVSEVKEKKENFEQLWEQTFNETPLETCRKYRFILIITKRTSINKRYLKQFTMRNILVKRSIELPL